MDDSSSTCSSCVRHPGRAGLPVQFPVLLGWELLPLPSLSTESCAWEGAVVIHGVSPRFTR